MTTPLISIVIPTFNRLGVLRGCLELLQVQTFRDFECIVVDNGPSTDGTGEFVRSLEAGDPRFRLMEMGPAGCVVARNTGFAASAASILMTLDDDVRLADADTLAYVHRTMKAHPEIGVLGIAEVHADAAQGERRTTRPAGRLRRMRDTTLHPPGLVSRWGAIGTRFQHLEPGRLHDVDHVRSSAMAVRRDAFDAAAGLFEPYTALGYGYRYETELCVQVKRRGFRVVYSTEGPLATHLAAERARGWSREGRSRDYVYYTSRNNTLFFLRNSWRGAGSALFMTWDLAVGSSAQPGLLRLALGRGRSLPAVKWAVTGKLEGWRMYQRYGPAGS